MKSDGVGATDIINNKRITYETRAMWVYTIIYVCNNILLLLILLSYYYDYVQQCAVSKRQQSLCANDG